MADPKDAHLDEKGDAFAAISSRASGKDGNTNDSSEANILTASVTSANTVSRCSAAAAEASVA